MCDTYIYIYRYKLIHNKVCVIHSDQLIDNKYAFENNTYIKDTKKQYIMWKPIEEKPQSCSSCGMTNGLAHLVYALSLHNIL